MQLFWSGKWEAFLDDHVSSNDCNSIERLGSDIRATATQSGLDCALVRRLQYLSLTERNAYILLRPRSVDMVEVRLRECKERSLLCIVITIECVDERYGWRVRAISARYS